MTTLMSSTWSTTHHDYEIAYIVVIAVILTLSTVAVALRVYTRFVVTRLSALDDYLLVWAQVVLITGCAIWLKLFVSAKRDYDSRADDELDHSSQVRLQISIGS